MWNNFNKVVLFRGTVWLRKCTKTISPSLQPTLTGLPCMDSTYKAPSDPFFPQCRLSVHRRRGLNDKHAPGLLTDSSAVICMSKATCCRSERGYPARIPGIPIPNGKLAFRVLVGSFLMRFRSGPGFSVTREERSKVNIAACAKSCMIIHTQTHTNLIYWSMWSGRVTGALLVLQQ